MALKIKIKLYIETPIEKGKKSTKNGIKNHWFLPVFHKHSNVFWICNR